MSVNAGDVIRAKKGWTINNSRRINVGDTFRVVSVDGGRQYNYQTSLDVVPLEPSTPLENHHFAWIDEYLEVVEQSPVILTSEEVNAAKTFPSHEELGKFLGL